MSDTVRVTRSFLKHSASVIDIDFEVVSDDGDTVASITTPTITPSGTLSSSDTDISGATAKVWLAGGTDEADYLLLVPIVTTLGRTEIGLAIIKVRD